MHQACDASIPIHYSCQRKSAVSCSVIEERPLGGYIRKEKGILEVMTNLYTATATETIREEGTGEHAVKSWCMFLMVHMQ